jgi:hypothetical protein
MLYCMCMDFERKAQEIIEAAEKALAALAAEAASGRDYPKAGMLLGLAQLVAGAIRTQSVPKQDVAEPLATKASRPSAPTNAFASATRAKSAVASYPRFKREDETLVKVGWSKSDRSTYEHRSPRAILDRLVTRILEVGASGERFTTEQILPLLDDENGELPSYQAYLCLAWLVFAGLLERHGRQGYTVSVGGDFKDAVEGQWTQLPAR